MLIGISPKASKWLETALYNTHKYSQYTQCTIRHTYSYQYTLYTVCTHSTLCRFNSNLSFDSHVSSICKTAFFHLKNISKLRPMLSMSNAETLIHAFMTSRLDYCNALLGGCSARLINKLQMVQNAAARVLTRTRKYDHISPVLSTLHWLPTKHRIDFKILLITYKALNGLAPQYLSELLSHYSPPRPLRSQNSGHLIIPRISKSTAGGRSFSYLAPKLWNNLPNTVREADTLCQFKSRLKTHLFNLAYT